MLSEQELGHRACNVIVNIDRFLHENWILLGRQKISFASAKKGKCNTLSRWLQV